MLCSPLAFAFIHRKPMFIRSTLALYKFGVYSFKISFAVLLKILIYIRNENKQKREYANKKRETASKIFVKPIINAPPYYKSTFFYFTLTNC